MKFQKIAIATASLLLAASVFSAPAFAVSTVPSITWVAGKVTTNNLPVNAAAVVVTCNSNVMNTSTNASGDYLVQYSYNDCPNSITAYVTATKNGSSGSAHSPVNHFVPNIELAVVNPVIPVPEFGLVAGGIAALSSMGVFLKLKKKS